jgi:uncharacterized membrane protein
VAGLTHGRYAAANASAAAALKNRAIRLSALQQAMVSYLFGTVILAVTVQVIGALSGL